MSAPWQRARHLSHITRFEKLHTSYKPPVLSGHCNMTAKAADPGGPSQLTHRISSSASRDRNKADDEPWVELSLVQPTPARPPALPRLGTEMSYQPLSRSDPDDAKSYGSVESREVSPSQSPTTALLSDAFELRGYKDHEKNPFADDDVAAYWRQVYKDCQYECRHEFDPQLTWTAEEERQLVRKLDLRVCFWAVRISPFLWLPVS